MEIDCSKLGDRIRLCRTAKKISQDGLAEMVDVSRVNISCLERGEYAPSLDTLVKLSTALGISTDCLLGLEARSSGTFFRLDQTPHNQVK